MVEHWGHSQIYNQRTLVLNTVAGEYSLDVQWLGIGVWKNQMHVGVSFECIEAHQNPLPETSGIQLMPQLVACASAQLGDLLTGLLPGSLPGSFPGPSSVPSPGPSPGTPTGPSPGRSLGPLPDLSLGPLPGSSPGPSRARSFKFLASAFSAMAGKSTNKRNAPRTPGATATPNADSTLLSRTFQINNKAICSLQTFCPNYNDSAHCQNYVHPFVTPCRGVNSNLLNRHTTSCVPIYAGLVMDVVN
ncbi:hypothetical protein BC936DRAFT_149136 [Jimgerdemannia flammicorona]|uniref:Uncharacterized protein n=1 Tax=Jimgerdemannia flammicorona TaxID=994334 RepID=A0A433D1H7_9FUNG|nr:hypothetical protein BC936DRAFT_149136 [Jimgerdemannia flammicorona]